MSDYFVVAVVLAALVVNAVMFAIYMRDASKERKFLVRALVIKNGVDLEAINFRPPVPPVKAPSPNAGVIPITGAFNIDGSSIRSPEEREVVQPIGLS